MKKKKDPTIISLNEARDTLNAHPKTAADLNERFGNPKHNLTRFLKGMGTPNAPSAAFYRLAATIIRCALAGNPTSKKIVGLDNDKELKAPATSPAGIPDGRVTGKQLRKVADATDTLHGSDGITFAALLGALTRIGTEVALIVWGIPALWEAYI